MASNKTLNTSNLEALGAARLAELLMEISEGNAAAKRRLRLELAGAQSPAELVKEIRKRLATIGRSRSFVAVSYTHLVLSHDRRGVLIWRCRWRVFGCST